MRVAVIDGTHSGHRHAARIAAILDLTRTLEERNVRAQLWRVADRHRAAAAVYDDAVPRQMHTLTLIVIDDDLTWTEAARARGRVFQRHDKRMIAPAADKERHRKRLTGRPR